MMYLHIDFPIICPALKINTMGCFSLSLDIDQDHQYWFLIMYCSMYEDRRIGLHYNRPLQVLTIADAKIDSGMP